MVQHYHHRSPSNKRSLSQSYTTPSLDSQYIYPGISPFGDIPQVGASALTPFQGAAEGLATPSTALGAAEWINPVVEIAPVAAAAKTGFSLASLGELKGVIDRMGGIDGLVSSIGKFQKVMSSVQQMAPMVKLVMGSLGKGTTKGKSSEDGDGMFYIPPKRRRKKSTSKSKKNTSRRTSKGKSTSNKNTPNKKRRK
ncbi:hypothetical protein [Paenibacillus sp. IHBB 10380]|uniref:hypothetical protein n=1 Tax=Paenibacillus sp. IHBB 10380 TaxID=1566358 RepID=UPI0005CFE11F|nr:hypothetical protein [Paenibacillus sp. IHBB 10380]